MEIKTVTGMTWDEVRALFAQMLPSEAYAPLPGGADLTGVKPAYLMEALTKAFGPAGYGWWLDVAVQPIEVFQETRTSRKGHEYTVWCAFYDRAVFNYRLVVDSEAVSVSIETNGGAENARREFAVRGAHTSAISGAAARLLWQLDVYKRKGDHKTAQRSGGELQEVLKDLTSMGRQRLNWNAKNTTDFLKGKGYTKENLVEQKEAAFAVLNGAVEDRLQEVLQDLASEAEELLDWDRAVTAAFLKEKGYTRDNLVVKEEEALKVIRDEQ